MTPTSRVRMAPTLETMSAMYRLSRQGGPRSERFRAYVARVEHEWGLVAYNPMAGEAAQTAVDLLLGIGAESLAREAAAWAVEACEYAEEITLALVVRSRGMWTDRVATEVELRAGTVAVPRNRGLVNVWSSESPDASVVRRESVAEAVRVMSTAIHGAARTVREFLWREGLAYALAGELLHENCVPGPPGNAPAVALTESDVDAVGGALDVLGDSTELSDVAAALFGDPACEAMGWPLLGLPANAGYAWAVRHATQQLSVLGPPAAVRQRVASASRAATLR